MKEKSNKLNHKQFSEWKFAIYDMQKADLKAQLCDAEYKILQRDLEIANLKMQLHLKNKTEPSRENVEQSKVEYEKIKSDIEKKIGYSLNGKAIDEITLEIRDLEK